MHTKKKTLLLGAHISISGGLEKAFSRGESIGCTAIQMFTKSNRQWNCKPLTALEIQLFKDAWKQSYIQDVIVHAAYLINIGSSNPEVMRKSSLALKEELSRCEQLGIPYLVLHPGSNGDGSPEVSLAQIAEQLDLVLTAVPGKTQILLETMAGQGSNLCSQFEELAAIYKASHHKNRIGVCFDTCHAFAAGYDMRTQESYQALWENFDKIIGLTLLKAIHVNDSKKELGSRVDRHEDIGKGKLGLEAFKLLFNDSRFFTIPKILETPKDDLSQDLKNMQKIVSLLSPETKKIMEVKVVDRIFEARASNR